MRKSTRSGAATLALALAALAPSAGAEADGGASCTSSPEDWEVVRGSLQRGARCGEYLAATDGDNGTFSYADLLYRAPVRPPIDLEVTWRRLGPESRKSIELRALGALLLLRDEEYGLYVWNEASFEWRKLPGYRAHDEHRVAIHQTATTLSFSVDGKPIDSWQVPAGGDRVGVGAKGAGGYRSWFAFRDFRVSSH